MIEVYERVTRYEFSALPTDDINRTVYTITVEYRGDDKWAVMWLGNAYDAKGRKKYEPLPSSRTEAFIRRYRHDLETAKRIAREMAPKIVVNGKTVEDALAWVQ